MLPGFSIIRIFIILFYPENSFNFFIYSWMYSFVYALSNNKCINFQMKQYKSKFVKIVEKVDRKKLKMKNASVSSRFLKSDTESELTDSSVLIYSGLK